MLENVNLISDADMFDDLTNSIRNRLLEQKFVYLDKGADLYYKSIFKGFMQSANDKKKAFVDFGTENCFRKDKKNLLISLGCGSSMYEKHLFEVFGGDYKLSYIGIDSSRSMIDMSHKNLKNLKDIQKTLICADFSTNVFRREISQIIHEHNSDNIIFAFFSNTFGNINHTNIIDILYNLLDSGEKIWLNVVLREGKTAKDDILAFERYFKYTKLQEKKDFYLNVLMEYGVKQSDGKFVLSTSKDKSLNAIKFEFSFEFIKKTTLNVRNEHIVILPGESIKLMQIYNYDMEGLIAFFKEHNFKFIKSYGEGKSGQLLFEKG